MKKIIGFASVILVLLLFVLTNITTISSYIEEDGFVMPKNSLSDSMSNITMSEGDNVNLLEIEEFDIISESFGNYYTEDNEQIDLNYPAIIRDGTAIKFINSGPYVISDDFTFAPTTEGSVISDQTYFNQDGGVADEATYFLTQLRNGLFITNTSFTVYTQLETFEISKYAIVYFDEDFINVYNYDNGSYTYLAIRGLQDATITYNDTLMTYTEFYEEIYKVSELVKTEWEQEEETKEVIKQAVAEALPSEPGNNVPDEVDPPENPPEIPEVDSGSEEEYVPSEPAEPVEPAYVEPVVSVSNINTWVYSINADVDVYDPSNRIMNGIVFNVYDEEGNLILRDSTKSSGMISLTTLPPDSTLVVEAYYVYYNEKGIQTTVYVLDKTVVYTIPFEGNIPEISLSYDDSDISYSKAIGLDNMQLSNTTDYDETLDDDFENFCKDILPYVYSMVITLEDEDGNVVNVSVGSSTLSKLRKSEIVDYVSSNSLQPNTTYTYTIAAFDRYGNEFTFDSDLSGTITTCKETPSLKIYVQSRETDEIIFDLTLSDPDGAITSEDYTIIIYYGEEAYELDYTVNGYTGEGENEVSISASLSNVDLSVTNLPYSVSMSIVAYADYDINGGSGVQENEIIGDLDFYTAGIPSGSVTFNNSFVDIAGTTVSMNLSLAQSSTTALIDLMTDFTMNFDTDGQSLSYTYTEEDLEVSDAYIEANYDDETGTLVIIKGNDSTLTPQVSISASKDTLLTYGVWETFCNSGYYGSTNVNSGVLTFTLMQGTLLSSSRYDFGITSQADLGTKAFDVTSYVTDDEFYTLGKEPIVYYEDYFIGGNFIEFYNVSVSDEDDVITNDTYYMQILEDGRVIDSITLDTSEITDTVRFDSITTGHEYTIQFVASEYNLTTDATQLQTNYIMKELTFYHEDGIQGTIDLTNLQYVYSDFYSTEGYGYVANNVTLDTWYNYDTNTIEPQEGYFVTDYLPYTPKMYSVFDGFCGYDDTLILSFYDANYNYVGETKTTNYEWLLGFNEVCFATQFNYSTAAYVVVTGTMGNEEEAVYFQYDASDLELIYDTDEDSSLFEMDVQINSTSADTVSITYASTGYIDCTAGEILMFKQNTDYLRIYFYDEAGNYLSYQGVYYNQTCVVEVPTNATQLRVMQQNSIIENDSYYAELYRISGTENLTRYATIEYTLTDTSGDEFFYSDTSDSEVYTVTKYECEIVENQTYDDVAYTHVEEITYNSLGDIYVDLYSTEIVKENMAYKYEISIEYNGHTIILDELFFNTDAKIYFINDTADMGYMYYDRYATYLVTQDIIQDASAQRYDIHFGGILDFQGYSYTFTKDGYTWSEIFDYLLYGGEIKNGEFILPEEDVVQGLVNYNFGTISNIKYTINGGTEYPIQTSLVDYNDEVGIIEDFIIEFNGDAFFYNSESTEDSAILVRYNYGTIRNGYIYNTDDDAGVYMYGRSGIVVWQNTTEGSIENIYADVDIYSNYDQQTTSTYYSGVIAGYNQGRATNIFAISTRYKFTYDSYNEMVISQSYTNVDDPLFGRVSQTLFDNSYENVYLLSKYQDIQNLYSTYFEQNSLHDTQWYDGVFNDDSNFLVDDLVSQGYFPILDLDSTMMDKQIYRELPELATSTKPEFLYATTINETKEYVDIELVFMNTSKLTISSINVENVGVTIYNQAIRDDYYVVTIRLADATEFVDEYLMSSYTYKNTYGNSFTVSTSTLLDASFYYSISTCEDFAWIESNLNSNVRLTNDIDFADYTGSWTDIYVNGTFTGTFDGGRYDALGELIGNYTIKNIDLVQTDNANDALFFYKLQNAEVKNVNFENISWIKETDNYASIIYYSYYSVIDNVHINSIDLIANYRVASLVNVVYGSTIQNCSASNVTIENGSVVTSGFTAGGLVGYATYSSILNSFVYNANITTHDIDLSVRMGVGGILGENNQSTYIANCYATGSIYNPSYNGGISGTGNGQIENCYSNVLIVADGDYNSGLTGYTSSITAENNLVLGDIIVMKDNTSYTHRAVTVDNQFQINNNYAYVGQTINNEDTGYDFTEGVLSYSELTTLSTYENVIKFGDAYDYSEISQGMLPKLYDTYGELLDNQPDIYLESSEVNMEVTYTFFDGAEAYTTWIAVNHPGYTISELTIDGMQLSKTAVSEETGLDSYSVFYLDSTKTKALDLYRATVTLISTDGTETEFKLVNVIDYGDPVYWEIETAEEWQDVMADHGYSNENILITAEIDFSTLTNPLYGISVNRLEGYGTQGGLTNINITDSSTDQNVVNSVYSAFANLTITDCSIDLQSTSYQYNIGIVAAAQAASYDLTIDNIDINVTKIGTTNVGVIAKTSGQTYDCTINDVNITLIADAYRTVNTGSLVGYSTSGFSNITATNINISAINGISVGGVVGSISKTDIELVDVSDVIAENITIDAAYQVGGIVGYMLNLTPNNVQVNNITLTEYYNQDSTSSYAGCRFGGVAGYSNYKLYNSDIDGVSIQNVTINANNYVGGVYGYGDGVYYTELSNIYVSGNMYVGGVSGYANQTQYVNISDSTIIAADKFAGGINGRGYQEYYNRVVNCTIEAGSYAGGLSGFKGSYNSTTDVFSISYSETAGCAVIDSSITTTTGSHAGGLIGYSYSYGSSLYASFVKDCYITSATGYAGGLVGEATTLNFYRAYVTGGQVQSLTGDYTGGLIGAVTHAHSDPDVPYSGNINRVYSNTTVIGNDYVGGIFGFYYTDYVDPSRSYRQLYSLINYSDVKGTGINVYAVGAIDEESLLQSINTSYYDAIVSYDEATVNGNEVTTSTLTNIIDESIYYLIDLFDMTYYPTVNNSLASNGLSMSTGYWDNYLGYASQLGSFDIVLTDINKGTSTVEYAFDFYNINLPDGTYSLSIYSSTTSTAASATFVSDVEFIVEDGMATYTLSYNTSTTTRSFYFSIANEANDVIYAQENFASVNYNYTVADISVNGEDINYKYSETNEDVTITIDDSSSNYVWYKVYYGQGYGATKATITTYAEGNTLTTDCAGIYFAVNTTTLKYSEVFIYETNVYYPLVSSSTFNLYDYQSGYYYLSDGAFASSYSDGLVYDGVALDMVPRTDMVYNPYDALEEAPEFEVYASGVDTINIEFDSTVDYSVDTPLLSMTIKSGSEEVTVDVTSRVMSFSYNFTDNLEISVYSNETGVADSSSDVYSKKMISADSLVSKVSVDDINAYYLTDDEVVILEYNSATGEYDTSTISGNFVMLYNDQALTSNGTIYDLSTSDTTTSSTNLTKQDSAVALYESYHLTNGDNLLTYKNFTFNDITDSVIDYVTFTKGTNTYAMDSATETLTPSLLADTYSSTTYTGYVNTYGNLVSTNLVLPDNFKNFNIVEISDTFTSSGSIVLVRYQYGQIVAFNYKTGEVIDLEVESSTTSIVSYALMSMSSISNMFSVSYSTNTIDNSIELIEEIESVSISELVEIEIIIEVLDELEELNIEVEEILESEDIVEALQEVNIEVDIEAIQTSVENREYVTIFDEEEQVYEVYVVDELLTLPSEELLSMEEKVEIVTSQGYEGELNNLVASKISIETVNYNVYIMIFIGISMLVLTLLFILKYKNKKVW